MNYTIRKGEAKDVYAAHQLIVELAIFERAPLEVTNTPEKMLADGFGPQPVFGFYLAELEGKVVGMSLYYTRYSTWKGRCLYLEDLIVTQEHRGKGLGRLLLDVTVREAREQDVSLMCWQVLDWNQPAIDFYKRMGADISSEWLNCKLTREQMQQWVYAEY